MGHRKIFMRDIQVSKQLIKLRKVVLDMGSQESQQIKEPQKYKNKQKCWENRDVNGWVLKKTAVIYLESFVSLCR